MEDNYRPECESSSFDNLLPSTTPSSPKQNPVAVSQPSQMTTLTTPADTEIEPSLMNVGDIDHIIAGYQGPVDLYCDYGNPYTVGSAATPGDSDPASGHLLAPSTRRGKARRATNPPRDRSDRTFSSKTGARVEKSRQGGATTTSLKNRPKTNSFAASTAAASADLPGTEIVRSEQPDSLNSMKITWPQSFGLFAVSEWNSTAPNRPAGSPQPDFQGSAIKADGTRQPFKSAEALHQKLVRNLCEVLCSVGSMSDEERNLKVERKYREIAIYKNRRTLQARFREVEDWVEELRSERKDWWHPPLNLPGGSAEAEKLKQTPPERIPIVEIRWKLCETCFKNKGELLPSCASTRVLTCYCGVPS